MRPYRGIRIDTGEMVKGYLIGRDVIVGEIVEFTEEYFYAEYWWKVNPETVGQYTGMKDKNGMEIYEGDIIKSIRGYMATVEWTDDGRFLGRTFDRSIVYVGQEPAVEVIGNIHQHPHLLGEVAQ